MRACKQVCHAHARTHAHTHTHTHTQAREGVLDQSVSFVEGADLSKLDPLSNGKMSDSSNLDESVTLAV